MNHIPPAPVSSEVALPYGAIISQSWETVSCYNFWLTTVSADGTPQPNLVWFHWDDEGFLIYTQPTSKKVKNLIRCPRVALHFDATPTGEDVVVFTGTAQMIANADEAQRVHHNQPYVEKYRDGLATLGSSPEKMGEDYSIIIRVHPDKVRGW